MLPRRCQSSKWVVNDVCGKRLIQVGVSNEFYVEVDTRKRKHATMIAGLLSALCARPLIVGHGCMGINEHRVCDAMSDFCNHTGNDSTSITVSNNGQVVKVMIVDHRNNVINMVVEGDVWAVLFAALTRAL